MNTHHPIIATSNSLTRNQPNGQGVGQHHDSWRRLQKNKSWQKRENCERNVPVTHLFPKNSTQRKLNLTCRLVLFRRHIFKNLVVPHFLGNKECAWMRHVDSQLKSGVHKPRSFWRTHKAKLFKNHPFFLFVHHQLLPITTLFPIILHTYHSCPSLLSCRIDYYLMAR